MQDDENPDGSAIQIYDPERWSEAVSSHRPDGDFAAPDEAWTEPVLTTEEEARRRAMRAILRDPRGSYRPVLHGTTKTAEHLEAAASTMPHFAEVTGIIARAVRQSDFLGRPVRFPPILMLSPPGIGKTTYSRRMAASMGTTCVPISIVGTSDRGQLGGLTPTWRGAGMGRLAKGLLMDSATAAPMFLLDEIDKPPELNAGENVLDVLLNALEPENASQFTDEYLAVPIRLDSALWLASANDTRSMPGPLLDRLLVVEVPWPDRDQSMIIARAICQAVLAATGLWEIEDAALEVVLDLNPRGMRRVMEMACAFAAAERRVAASPDHMRKALRLSLRPDRRRPVGFTSLP